ncbi:unnamed protein product, partial [marine sediment metagenome]
DVPDDVNVFDIEQGVAVGLFRRLPARSKTTIRHMDLWGSRESKYAYLQAHTHANSDLECLTPNSPFYFFVPWDETNRQEYETGWSLSRVFPMNSVGIVTARDSLSVHYSKSEVWRTVQDFSSLPTEEARQKYSLGKDVQSWKVHLAQKDLRETGLTRKLIKPILYRPFDVRFTYYTGTSGGFICRPLHRVMRHMLTGENMGLVTIRRSRDPGEWRYAFVTSMLIAGATSITSLDMNYLYPLYTYAGGNELLTKGKREANLSHEFTDYL